MIEYNDKKIFCGKQEYDFKGLNTSHILWHLQEQKAPELFFNTLNETYSMPSRIGSMSIAEGSDFDALLIDNKLFRYEKLSEADRYEVQDYINKYAYATALMKLNECSHIIGCGLEHEYNTEEQYKFLATAYEALLENTIPTNERGRLVESFGSDKQVGIYEGSKYYIRGTGDKRMLECWENNYKHSDILKYQFNNASKIGSNVIVSFSTPNGELYEAEYKNTSLKLITPGINLHKLLKESNLVGSYRVGTLLEYHQPFTFKASYIRAYEIDGSKLKLTVRDAFGNGGFLYLVPKIDVNKFVNKYKDELDEVLQDSEFSDAVVDTAGFFEDAANDIESISGIKGKTVDDEGALSYKIYGFTPETGEGETVFAKGGDFFVKVTDDSGAPYNLVYTYSGNNIKHDVDEMNALADELDFDDMSDVYAFYSMINDYGSVRRSAKRGISTKDRNYQRNKKEEGEIMEGEGVQVTDIAPKVDQNVGVIQVKMKKKKNRKVESDAINFNKSDLLISKINEADEFYGSRGFIKDENGRYHFNDYYVTESGKVVHKSKLQEESRTPQSPTVDNLIKNFEDFAEGKIVDEDLVNEFFTDLFLSVNDEEELELINEVEHYIRNKYNLEESIIVEDEKTANAAYYRVNDAALILYEVADKYVKDGSELDKKFTQLMLDLNSIQMAVYKENLNEAAKYSDIAGKDGIKYYHDMLYNEEPQSTYDKLLKKAYEVHDQYVDLQDKAKADKDKEAWSKAIELDKLYVKLLATAENIPVEDRGPLYSEFIEIDKANQDEYAQSKGYDNWDAYQSDMWGLHKKVKESEDFVVDKDVDDVPVDLAKMGKCPYCTGPMTPEEYKLYGMCQECWDNGVE